MHTRARLSELIFEETEIKSICEKLNINKSEGPDEVPSVPFRNCIKTISHSLFQIFTKILQTSVFPDFWKTAIITIQLLQYVDQLYNCFDANDDMHAIYFDVQKSFDTVCHKTLLSKLKRIGFDDDF